MPESQESPPPTRHALERYTAPPESVRQGIALCLSGGGYRALLFHLGALTRLNELGILARLRTISSVSGGSIASARLASASFFPLLGPVAPSDWDREVAGPLRAFAARNIRTPAILQRFLPWNWFRTSTGVEALARACRGVTGLSLPRLPQEPNFLFSATDMAFGVNWIFERRRMGDYQAGYALPRDGDPLARAVAASSCFPPIFNPLPIRLGPKDLTGGKAPKGPERDRLIRGLRLTDGGNYDNLGLEPVWKSHATILCSDGGAIFDFEPDRGLFWRLKRHLAIIGNQALALRKRWLIGGFIDGQFEGTYWGVASAVASFEVEVQPAYSKAFAQEVIANIRTDFDAFSDSEIAVLENHGYTLAEAAIRRHLPQLLPSPAPPLVLPRPWIEEDQARNQLARSGRRKLLGRFKS
ncbi:MAG TPA: patatin-like phospholipase family protein [Thermoanaerobaculia bacterium]|nr:patatin-like phospholipase family protein [Thermoanaerobaculia bacterium]